MADLTAPRTSIEKLLIELLYQTIPAESSDDYIVSRLLKAGLTLDEIKKVME